MTKKEMQFRNSNIRRLRRIGIAAESIRAKYEFAEGSKSPKRVYEIADWYWRDHPEAYIDSSGIPIEEGEAIRWLETNETTIKAFKKIGLPGVYSSTGHMGETLAGKRFQVYFMLSDVERLLMEWDAIPNIAKRIRDLSNRYIREHLSEIRHISSPESTLFLWKGKQVQNLVKITSAIECKRGKPKPEPKPATEKKVKKDKPKVEIGNYVWSYILKVSELITCKKPPLIGRTFIQTILLSSPGLAGLIESNIPPEEIALFINSIEQDPPHSSYPNELLRAVLSNPHLHILIAMEARLRDVDKFYQEWLVDMHTSAYSRKEPIVI